MSEPRLGMRFNDCARRIKRISANPGHPVAKANIINSLRNQCRLAEGESALKELDTIHKKGSTFMGAGSKQIGFGPGRKLGEGRWQYKDGKWFCIDQ